MLVLILFLRFQIITQTLKEELNNAIDVGILKLQHVWMERLPTLYFKLPEPKESNFTTDKISDPKIKFDYGKDYDELFYSDSFDRKCLINIYDERDSEISRNKYHLYGNVMWILTLKRGGGFEYTSKKLLTTFNIMKQLFKDKLDQLKGLLQRSLALDPTVSRNKILQQEEELNQIIFDMNDLNDILVTLISDYENPMRDKFKKTFSLTDANIKNHKLLGYCILELRRLLNDLIDLFLPQLHALWVKLVPPEEILRFDNSVFKNNKHKSPGNVDISSTIAIHVICDAVLGSYSINATKDLRATPGYILFTFSPNVSPGSLIVMNPPFLTYLETTSGFISRMNFKIVDQNFSLIDLRGEQLQLTLEIRS